jgi:hypothetical protein
MSVFNWVANKVVLNFFQVHKQFSFNFRIPQMASALSDVWFTCKWHLEEEILKLYLVICVTK